MMVYRIVSDQRAYTGIVLGVGIDNFNDGSIVHHEQTIPNKVAHQTELVKKKNGLKKPILLTHQVIPEIKTLIDELTKTQPTVDIQLDKYHSRHQLWSITEPSHILKISSVYSDIENTYIVDGHHRTAAIQALGSTGIANHGLCALFDVDELDILPFHRVVQTDISPSVILDKLKTISTLEEIENPCTPSQSNELVCLINGKAYLLRWNADLISDDQVAALDVNLLSTHILKNILGITSERDSNIKYVEGNQTAESIGSKLDSNEVAFLLHPIDIQDLIQITDAQQLLPPKSTWFLPRMASGLMRMDFDS